MNRTVKGFIRKELGQAFRDPRMLALLFVAPVIQILMFGYAVRTDIKNISLGVLAAPDDRMASRLADRAYSSGYFVPVRISFSNPMGDLESGRVNAVLIAPPGGLSRAFGRGEGSIQVLVDATNSVRARSVELYLGALASEVAQEARSAGSLPQTGVHFDTRILYNPTMESYIFMVPALAVLVLSEILILLTAMAIAREKELGTMEMLLSAPISRWEILAGKTLPFLIMAFINAPLVITAGILWFDVPFRGSLWEICLASVIFATATASVGMLVSTLARNQQQAMIGSFMFMLTAMMLSGVFFPVENMPPSVYWVTFLNPLRYFVTLLRNIILKGGDPAVVWPNMAGLAVIAGATAFVAVRRFRQTLN